MRSILTKLAAALSPEMYRVAVQASQQKLRDEVMIQSLTLMCDELGRELVMLGYSEEQVSAVIDRAADKASMAADILLMMMAEENDAVTPASLLDAD